MDLEYYRLATRSFIKDEETFNRLLGFKVENEDTYVDLYLNMAIGFLNMTPPPVGSYTFADFPFPALLIHRATLEGLISNNIVQARNDLTYNNGGVTAKVADGGRYLPMIQVLMSTISQEMQMFTQMRIAININGGWGGVVSPYAWLHGRSATLHPNSILDG